MSAVLRYGVVSTTSFWGRLDGTVMEQGGAYRAIIDRAYPLEDVIEVHRYVGTQQKVGNVVLTVR